MMTRMIDEVMWLDWCAGLRPIWSNILVLSAVFEYILGEDYCWICALELSLVDTFA
jgi:hypothetical protein